MKPIHPVPIKHCLHCGTEMLRKRYNGRLEDRATFLRRQFCSLDCSSVHSLKESVSLSGLYRRATQLKGSVCQRCGSENQLGIHHEDRNPANNSPENLLTLCASCHTALHWKEGKKPWKARAQCKTCGSPARRNGFCQKHWQRFKKYGDPNLTKRRGRSGPMTRQPMSDSPALTNSDCSETVLTQMSPPKRS